MGKALPPFFTENFRSLFCALNLLDFNWVNRKAEANGNLGSVCLMTGCICPVKPSKAASFYSRGN